MKNALTIEECCKMLGWSRATWMRRQRETFGSNTLLRIPGSWPYLFDRAKVMKWAKKGPRTKT